jgi:hypothetical protein
VEFYSTPSYLRGVGRSSKKIAVFNLLLSLLPAVLMCCQVARPANWERIRCFSIQVRNFQKWQLRTTTTTNNKNNNNNVIRNKGNSKILGF